MRKRFRALPLGRPDRPVIMLAAIVTVAILALLAFAACGDSEGAGTTPPAAETPTAGETPTADVSSCPPAGAATSLNAAGATFPFPLYSKWIDEYKQLCDVSINYQSIGSGGGIKGITDKTVDYAGSDAIMNDEQTAAAEAAGGSILHIPMTMGGIAVTFNLEGIQSGELKLDPDVLADIFLKKITKWNDPAISALNPDLSLPDAGIAVVHRSDGSGTTFQFTSYLSKVSTEWNDEVGAATSVEWPGDVGGEGNEGVANQVSQVPGAIGYVEVAYAIQNDLPWAALANSSGNYEEPTLEAISAAAEGVTLPEDMKILLVDSDNPNAYPIAGFTWVLAYVNQTDTAKGQTLASYLTWSIHDGQEFSEALDYAKMPADAVDKAETLIESLTCGAGACLQAQ
jgi:phosphate transport system substrate-binding protein